MQAYIERKCLKTPTDLCMVDLEEYGLHYKFTGDEGMAERDFWWEKCNNGYA